VSSFHRVVFDTSTLVSAALRVGSAPHQALKQAISLGEVYVSAATLSELAQVLLRPKFDRYQARDVRQAFVDLVRALAVQVPVSAEEVTNVLPACRDPKDDPFLALVLACDADVLVSSDADLLVLHPWRAVPVLTPGAYLLSNS
jgi:putative PIN family toxin of toxin-antitoxin system